MQPKFMLCKYSVNENGEVKLIRVADEYFHTVDEAKNRALELYREDDNSRFVVLQELVLPIDSRTSSG
jgi:hypothetical protein